MNKFFVLCLIVGCIVLEPTRGLNPYEVVAIGGEVQAEVILAEEESGVLDVKEAIDIEKVGGVLNKLIPRNIPNKKSQIFSTASDNQHSVTIQVNEGEGHMTKDKYSLGKFDFIRSRSNDNERRTENKEKITTNNDENIELTITETLAIKDKKDKNKVVKRIKWRFKTHRHFRKPLLI